MVIFILGGGYLNNIINYKEAVKKLNNIGEVIIKPTLDSNSGHNVRLLNIKNGLDSLTNQTIEEIMNKYKENFTIQERIKPHPVFSKLNPTSINTIRINTYICEGKVYVSPIAMRIGRMGKVVDNAHAGGVTVGVDKNGCLMEYGFFQTGEKFSEHPDTHVKFNGYKIPRLLEMIEFVKNNHYRIPNMGIIAWDLTLDENENIVIIETNIQRPSIWFPQYSTGEAFFGENTEKMIQMLKNK